MLGGALAASRPPYPTELKKFQSSENPYLNPKVESALKMTPTLSSELHTHTHTNTFIPHTYTQYASQSLSIILISKMPIMSTECKATVETKFVASL